MKNLLLILSLIFSVSSFGVTLKVSLDGSDQVRFLKYLEAVREVESVINSEGFKSAIYEKTYSSTKKYSSEVFASIYAGSELLKKDKDGVWDWKVGFYYKKSKVIGWTNGSIMTVWVNTYKFDRSDFEIWDVAGNIAHEYMHKIGYDHASAKDHRSVPYAIGYIVRDLVKKNMTAPKPSPTPDTVSTPDPEPLPDPVKEETKTRRSWWSRLKLYLFGG